MNARQCKEYMEYIQTLPEKALKEELFKVTKSKDTDKNRKVMIIYIEVDKRDSYISEMKLRIHLFLMNETIKEKENK